MGLREDADEIIEKSIRRVLPDEAVKQALEGRDFGVGEVYVVAAGKAAWQMAKAAEEILGRRITSGVVCTKYGHVKGEIQGFSCYEGGHPVPDENSFRGTEAALELVSALKEEDTVLFLLSGGGSALFEKPLVHKEELTDITSQLLGCGADIVEINTIRKRLSAVKGGKFAKLCEPASVYAIVQSDVLGDHLDMIASGPVCADTGTKEDAKRIVKKYGLRLSDRAQKLLEEETPKELKRVETVIHGSVRDLCIAAKETCESLGYEAMILTDQMDCQAKEAGSFLAAIAKTYAKGCGKKTKGTGLAFIAGGETVVKIIGKGKGGRNQELALAAAQGITGLGNVAVFSVGSDGTDGPTDAAGGYVDGSTKELLEKQGMSVFDILAENDAYHALQKTGGLIVTGATGTNVNDVAVVLIRNEKA